jgi:hypothetical protein
VELYTDVAGQYADFATYARGDSPCFEDWADGVAADPEALAWIAALPPVKQQPNLVFAAARWHGVPAPAPYAALRAALLGDDGAIRATILERATQTNEVGRLATLAPAFARLAGGRSISLLEVGASAGLCLYPDRYAYAWTTEGGLRTAGAGPVLACEVTGPAPLPDRLPAVAWRGGIDLNPLDVQDDDAMGWLTMLVWPEHEDRRVRLTDAIAVARSDPPELVRGDLLDELPALVDRAARHAPVVVFHSAVIAYLEDADRRRFEAMMRDLVASGRCRWVSNEGRGVLPDVTASAGADVPSGKFVLGIDGQAVAWTHGHGRSMTWLD